MLVIVCIFRNQCVSRYHPQRDAASTHDCTRFLHNLRKRKSASKITQELTTTADCSFISIISRRHASDSFTCIRFKSKRGPRSKELTKDQTRALPAVRGRFQTKTTIKAVHFKLTSYLRTKLSSTINQAASRSTKRELFQP